MAANATQHRSVRALCEGAIMVALAQILAYLKLYELPQGGSITLAMVPIFFFAVRWGWSRNGRRTKNAAPAERRLWFNGCGGDFHLSPVNPLPTPA